MATGKVFLPTGGEREGDKPKIKTIVSKMITSEPFRDHAQADPVKASEQAPAPDPDVASKLPPGATAPDDVKPKNTQTPEGTQVGTGFTDTAGNVISDVSDKVKTGVSGINDTVNGVNQQLDNAIGGVKDELNSAVDGALGDAAAGLGLDSMPTFEGMEGAFNNFNTLLEGDLLSIDSLSGLIAGIKAVLPPIRFPTTNALGAKAIGIGKTLNEVQARLNQFALDKLGMDLDMLGEEMKAMKGKINDAIAQAGNLDELTSALESQGITMLQDGPGKIFQDNVTGNMLVDFDKGIGPVGATLGAVSDLTKSYDEIKTVIKEPLSGNQTLAVTNFANSIGAETFQGSKALEYINDPGKHHMVGTEMQKWILDKPGGKIDESLKGQRQYEAQLFATPDALDIKSSIARPDGSATWAMLADELEDKNDEFYVNEFNKRSGG